MEAEVAVAVERPEVGPAAAIAADELSRTRWVDASCTHARPFLNCPVRGEGGREEVETMPALESLPVSPPVISAVMCSSLTGIFSSGPKPCPLSVPSCPPLFCLPLRPRPDSPLKNMRESFTGPARHDADGAVIDEGGVTAGGCSCGDNCASCRDGASHEYHTALESPGRNERCLVFRLALSWGAP